VAPGEAKSDSFFSALVGRGKAPHQPLSTPEKGGKLAEDQTFSGEEKRQSSSSYQARKKKASSAERKKGKETNLNWAEGGKKGGGWKAFEKLQKTQKKKEGADWFLVGRRERGGRGKGRFLMATPKKKREVGRAASPRRAAPIEEGKNKHATRGRKILLSI